jgi:hypothetical protein
LDPPPQHHHPPRTAPARQPEFAFHRLEALANPLPVTLLPLPLNQALDRGKVLADHVNFPTLTAAGYVSDKGK